MIPVFIVTGLFETVPACQYIAIALFLLASLTDLLDGYVARKYDMITDFGKFLDPLADKLLVTAALALLVHQQRISVWVLFIVVLREFVVTGLRLIAVNNGRVIAAGLLGKLKTVVQMIVISLALLPVNIGMDFALFGSVTVLDFLMYLMVFLTLLSGLEYVIKNRDVINQKG